MDLLKFCTQAPPAKIIMPQDFDEALSNAKTEVDKARLELQVKEATKFTNQELIQRVQAMQSSSRFETESTFNLQPRPP